MIFQVDQDLMESMILLITALLIVVIISLFYVNWGSRMQLVQHKYILIMSTLGILPGIFYLFFFVTLSQILTNFFFLLLN